MTSLPQYFSNEFYEFPMAGRNGGGIPMWGDENSLFFNDGVLNVMPHEYGFSDMIVPTLPDCNNMGSCGSSGTHCFHESINQHDIVCKFGGDCNGLLSNFWPPLDRNTWGIQGRPIPEVEESTLKIRRYSVEERKDRIRRYLKKRNQRNFNKTIKYACRKNLADKRVRVRGRFAKNNEPCEDEEVKMIKKNDNNIPHEAKDFCYGDYVQLKDDDEELIQEAMASLMYLPYICGSYDASLC